MLAAINFHYIRHAYNAPYPGINGTTPEKFEQQLKRLGKQGEFVGQNDIAEALTGGKPLPNRSMLITFDDGLQEQFDIAYPILEQLGIPFTCFVNSKSIAEKKVLSVHKIHLFRNELPASELIAAIAKLLPIHGLAVDLDYARAKGSEHYKYDTPEDAELKYLLNFVLSGEAQAAIVNELFELAFPGEEAQIHDQLYMSHAQVTELASKGYLGSHGHDHYPIGTLGQTEQIIEIAASKSILEGITGQSITAFSYPYGGKLAVKGLDLFLKTAGYHFALTMERAVNHSIDASPFYLSRFDNNDMPGGKAYQFENDDFFQQYPAASWAAAWS